MARARKELICICYKDFHLLRTGFRCPSSHIYEEILIPRILETFDGFGKEGSCFFHPPPFQFIFFKPCCDSGVQVPSITCLPQPLTFDIKCTWSGAGSLLQTLFIWMGLAAGRLQKKVHEQWFLFSVFKTDLLYSFCWLFWKVLTLKLERNHYLSRIHLKLRPVAS